MALSVDVIVAAHDQLSESFESAAASVDTVEEALLSCGPPAMMLGGSILSVEEALKQCADETKEFSAANVTEGMEDVESASPGATEALSLLRNMAGSAGIQFTNLGPITRAAALMIRSSGETAKAGWIGILGPIALVVAAVGGVIAVVNKLKSKWAEEAEEAKKAFEAKEKAAKEHADFLIEQEIRIAKARGDQERVWELQMQQGGAAARKAIEERYKAEMEAASARMEAASARYKGRTVLPGEEFGAVAEFADIRARREEGLARLQAAEQAERKAHEFQEWYKGEKATAEVAEGYRKAAEQRAKEAQQEGERLRREAAQGLLHPPSFGIPPQEEPGTGATGAAAALPAYRQLEAFESMLALRAPGQDPMERQVELSKQMLAELAESRKANEQTANNTKPAGAGTWKPAPVY